jgi:tetratricopeptide (TPR) repeat protein
MKSAPSARSLHSGQFFRSAALLCTLLSQSLFAGQKVFDFNSNCQQAYHEIISLKLEHGELILEEEKKKDPNNLVPYFLENYLDFFILYFTEDPTEFRRRKSNEDIRIRKMNEGPDSSPYYLFSKAIIHFQWAAVNIKFGHNWDAGWEFRRSFLQIKENRHRFPDFYPNALLEGTMQVTAGTIPDGYRWLSNLLGISGTIDEGMVELKTFIDRQDSLSSVFHEEAIFYWLYLTFYIQNQKDKVFDYISKYNLDIRNNHLFAYLAANLAINAQKSAYAESIIRQINHEHGYLSIPAWDLEMGTARMNHLEKDANLYFERFVSSFKGNFYLKEVFQKLSWYYFLNQDLAKANAYRKMVIQQGTTDTEADKQAMNEAKSGRWPDPFLLRARLLEDGGYFQEALKMILTKDAASFSTAPYNLEYAYRLGRIYDDLGNEEEAISSYSVAISTGSQSRAYYAARAALQTGYIYERRKDYTSARNYFQKCLSMKDHEYKNSLDQKAKAGLMRCRQKE